MLSSHRGRQAVANPFTELSVLCGRTLRESLVVAIQKFPARYATSQASGMWAMPLRFMRVENPIAQDIQGSQRHTPYTAYPENLFIPALSLRLRSSLVKVASKGPLPTLPKLWPVSQTKPGLQAFFVSFDNSTYYVICAHQSISQAPLRPQYSLSPEITTDQAATLPDRHHSAVPGAHGLNHV
jgi:hypothetical protein